MYLDSQDTSGRKAPHAQLINFVGTIETDGDEVSELLKKVNAK